MATVTETTESLPRASVSKSNDTSRGRSEASIRRFLIKNKGYEFIGGRLKKKEIKPKQ